MIARFRNRRERQRASHGRRRGAGVCGAVALGGALLCCAGPRVVSSRSASLLVIDRIEASRVGEGASSTVLQSDVVTEGTARDDIARVTTRLELKDPGSPTSPTAPTSANIVTVDRYRVEYLRSDGRNMPGVDVPFAFGGGITFATGVGVDTAEFVLVRATAKLEAPLLALAGGGGAVIINTTARVTLSGHDQTGAPVRSTGHITVHFSDWADTGVGDGAGSESTDDDAAGDQR